MIADIAADIGAEIIEKGISDIPDSTQMKLGDPIFLTVQFRGLSEDVTHEAVDFCDGKLLLRHSFAENFIGISGVHVSRDGVFQSVIAGTASAFSEVVMAHFECIDQIADAVQFDIESLCDLIHIGPPCGGENFHRFIRPPGGTDEGPAECGIGTAVIFQSLLHCRWILYPLSHLRSPSIELHFL